MTESPEQKNQPNFLESESSQPILNRRQFIGAGAAAAAALILPKSAQADSEIAQNSVKIAQANPTCTPPSLTPPSDTSFIQPNVVTSAQLDPSHDYCTLNRTLNVVGKPYSDVGDSTTLVRAFDDPQATTQTPALYPGPTLCVNPGDSIELTINNNLNQANGGSGVDPDYCPGTMNRPNCFDTMNMHFHGLHVSPISVGTDNQSGEAVYLSSADPRVESGEVTLTKSSDDVLYELLPGKNHSYCLWLPAFHAPGTHWYHAHKHGSTAIQVAGGMVGALIIKEPDGKEICAGTPDVVMIIQEEPESGTNGNTAQDKLDRGIYERTGRGNSGKFHINGIENPTLNVEKGEIQRWRIINANSTPRAFMNLELRAGNSNAVDNQGNPTGALQTLYRIAVDGINLYGRSMNDTSVNLTQVPFSPGNRVDLLVDFRSSSIPAGTYTLWKAKSPNLGGSGITEPLATIEVGSTDYDNAEIVAASFTKLLSNGIPLAGKPAYLDPITKFQPNTTPIAFQAAPGSAGSGNPGKGNYTINNGKYSSTTNTQASLSSSQEWIVANAISLANRSATHPFHIHVNPFLVVATAPITSDVQNVINNTSSTQDDIYQALSSLAWTNTSVADNGIDPDIWWDTFPIEGNTAYKIRHRFDDYWGKFVLHCHVLIHEDQGMMWNVQINDMQGQGANPCQQLLNPVITGEPRTI
ncbi:MAG: multicopper oxidase domain-containing protein [Cyanobacteria bacterium J06642_3]